MSLVVEQVGPQVTIQDLGRPGHGGIGVPRGGAVDRAALRRANRWVGNREDAAGLECLLGMVTLRAESAVELAVTGAPVALRRNGCSIAGPVLTLGAGDTLELGACVTGLRAYVAFRGGIEAPRLYGSASSSPTLDLGPTPLISGDRIAVGSECAYAATGFAGVDTSGRWAEDVLSVRVVPGPRDDWFVPDALSTLWRTSWRVTNELDRVGIRLTGGTLPRALHDELPSEGMMPGSIQVPPSGEPIIFLADHPPTGGYPVIGVIADEDLDRLGQARPGDTIRFVPQRPRFR